MISILMPVFNEEKHLEVCLESIINQTEKDWELLAVDDFSLDKSWEILQEFASIDSRIRPLKNKTKGIISALELAYAQSKGSTITRMDADDKMHPEKLKKLNALLGLNPKSCVTAMVEYFSEDVLAGGFLRYAKWLNDMAQKGDYYRHIYKECVVASPCWMMRKETLDDIGGICGNQYPEDYDMVFRLYSHDVEIKAVPEVLHFWRDHGARASRNDPNYAQQDFVDLKLHYLLKCEDLAKRKVILWGAGRTGKLWAKALIEKEIDFSWVTDNEKKIGKDIYGVRLQKAEINIVCKNSLLLIAIKAPSFYEERNDTLIKLKYDHQIIRLY